ncbi:MAG: 3-hydroxyacyl-CoA dehydrogenase [Cyclobacteriaceae bacterium]|nr:3-hydroxyacyl-CoA dehydrogenase [Cyclobacteriaceae bacterium]
MKILVIGASTNLEEAKAKFGEGHHFTVENDHREAERFVENKDLVLDFILDEEPYKVEIYENKAQAKVFVNTAKISLAELSSLRGHEIKATLFGFNGLPTFLNREVMEVSVLRPTDIIQLAEIAKKLGTEFMQVDDRVGLVTPRVICMIINEAYYTVQEGTATRDDIDLAMKLGTNYPFGPFEWCKRIGIKHVYELLEAVYEDTHDERYKICSLLKREYLMQSST